MSAFTEGRILGDAIDRYIKKRKQLEDYPRSRTATDKSQRQWERAAEGLAQAFANFSPGNVDGLGVEDEALAQKHLQEIGVTGTAQVTWLGDRSAEGKRQDRQGRWGEVGNHSCLSEDWLLENLPEGWSYDCQAFAEQLGFTITASDGSTMFLPLRLLAPPPERSAA